MSLTKKFLCFIAITGLALFFSNCGGSSAISTSSSTSSDSSTISMPSISYVNYSPLDPSSSSSTSLNEPEYLNEDGKIKDTIIKNAITIDDDNSAMGEDQSWILEVAKNTAEFITFFVEGLLIKDSSDNSLLVDLSTTLSSYNEQGKTSILGPVTVKSSSVYVAIDFSAFTGCASGGGACCYCNSNISNIFNRIYGNKFN